MDCSDTAKVGSRPQRAARRVAAGASRRGTAGRVSNDPGGPIRADAMKRRCAQPSSSTGSTPESAATQFMDAQPSEEGMADAVKRTCGSKQQHQAASDSEVTSPGERHYIQGTHLIAGGWFQTCRGCNEVTAQTMFIWDREVPLCRRCQAKYTCMVVGHPPPWVAAPAPDVDPLSYWIPQRDPMPPMAPDVRKATVDILLLQQDMALRSSGHS